MATTFQDLGLSPVALEAIAKKGFTEPTEIQAKTIPLLLESKQDVIAQAQTGTGKTATFGLVFTDKLTPGKSRSPQVIVLAPTRELAIQVADELDTLKGEKDFSIVPIYGGQSWGVQLRHLQQGVDIVVGTPGRIMDHLDKGTLKLDAIEYFVLDEADEMLNMGFIDDVEKILSYVEGERQMLLFSATMPKRISDLAKKYMHNPVSIKTETDQIANNSVEQIFFEVPGRDKFDALCRIIDMEEEFYGIIFCRTKVDSDMVSRNLNRAGYRSEACHGDVSQDKRETILENFRQQHTQILVATDVAARGIDVKDLTHVVNYSLPQSSEVYVHRIGRTGRAGKDGKAITLISPAEYRKLRMYESHAKATINKEFIPDGSKMVELKKRKIMRDVEAAMTDTAAIEKFKTLAQEMFADQDPEDVMAALLKLSHSDTLDESKYKYIRGTREFRKGDNGGSRPRERYRSRMEQTRLRMTIGHKDGANPGRILQMIENDYGVSGRSVGKIDIMDTHSFVSVPDSDAETILSAFSKNDKRSRSKLRIERAALGHSPEQFGLERVKRKKIHRKNRS